MHISRLYANPLIWPYVNILPASIQTNNYYRILVFAVLLDKNLANHEERLTQHIGALVLKSSEIYYNLKLLCKNQKWVCLYMHALGHIKDQI